MGAAEEIVRPLGDVKACNAIPIRLVAAFCASEVDIAYPVLSAYMPASWTSLRRVVRLNLSNDYALSFSYMLQGMPKEPVGYTVNLLSALSAPLTPSLPEIPKLFDNYVCVELLSEFNNFVCYLPHPRADIVSLFSAEPFELDASLTSGDRVSILLEFSPSLLEPELSHRNILPKIGLLQHLLSADYGYGDFRAVYIYAHPVWSDGGFWRFFLEDDEKSKVLLHNDAGCRPSIVNVTQKSLVGSVSIYWSCYSSFAVSSKANYWVPTPGFTEAEKSLVEADNAPMHFPVYGLSVVPSVEDGFQDQLGCNATSASEVLIVLALELRPPLSSPSQRQQLLNHTEERSIGLLQQPLLSFCWLKKVQRQALLHPAALSREIETENFKVSPNPPTLTDGDSLEVFS